MNSVNFNRRLVLKGIGAIGTSGALVACGGGGNSDAPGIQYFTALILYPIASLAISITAEALEDRWK